MDTQPSGKTLATLPPKLQYPHEEDSLFGKICCFHFPVGFGGGLSFRQPPWKEPCDLHITWGPWSRQNQNSTRAHTPGARNTQLEDKATEFTTSATSLSTSRKPALRYWTPSSSPSASLTFCTWTFRRPTKGRAHGHGS